MQRIAFGKKLRDANRYPGYIGDSEVNFVDKNIVMNFFKNLVKYEEFVLDQADYARKLETLEHLAID